VTKDIRIVFMGTPDFAVASLKILLENNYQVVGVVTAPDKPAGRGQELQQSAVKKYALEKGLTILQPEKLKAASFLTDLQALNADLQIVVAFRMLPEAVWNMPPKGTFNLHGSLLPQYRGAAPINWAVINGDTETGVSTFFLQHEIDTGKIIFRAAVPIHETDTAGDVHDRLMHIGADLVLKTVDAIITGNYTETAQSDFSTGDTKLKTAPKLFKEDCKINWAMSTTEVYNKVRGLSPYPTAFTEVTTADGKTHSLKIFATTKEVSTHTLPPGTIHTDHKTFFKLATTDGFIHLTDLQLAGKKRMPVAEFLKGWRN
jgi:methionyl-tRNA formyltransferase